MTIQKKSGPIFKHYVLSLLILLGVFAVLFLLMQNRVFNKYTTGLVIQIFYNIILTLSLNVATGFLGELCLGHA